MSEHTPFVIGVEFEGDGAHPAAWRAAAHEPGELLTGNRIAHLAALAERSGFTYAHFAGRPTTSLSDPDIVAELDAIQRAAFAAPLTGALGLVASGEVLATEPFHLATQLISLDIAAGGRAGWFVQSEEDAEAAEAITWQPASGPEILAETNAVIEVSRQLWDSWQDDAVIRDTATGRYLDPDRLHYLNFASERFSVVGPSITPRPPQGQLPIFARHGAADPTAVDIVVISAPTVGELIQAAAEARAEGARAVVALIDVALSSAGATGEARIDALDAHTEWGEQGVLRVVGEAPELVDAIVRLAPHVSGVQLRPAVIDVDVPELATEVLPALRSAGLFVSPRVGDTLRTSFGLEKPANRFEQGAAA